MKRRKRRGNEPRPKAKPATYRDQDFLCRPGGPQRLDSPNLSVELDLTPLADLRKAKLPHSMAWPLIRVLRAEIDELGRSQHRPVFVDDETLGPQYPDNLGDHPPTFMDPHLFVRLAQARPEIQEVLDECLASNSLVPAREKLPELLEAVLDDYLAELVVRYAEVQQVFVEWLPRNWYYLKNPE